MFGACPGLDPRDRDGGIPLLSTLFGQFPFLKVLFADSAYAGSVFRDGLATEIVRSSDQAKGFAVLPNRWVSNAPSVGWLAAADWPRTGKIATATRSASSGSHPSA
jgi:hypothetical protein